MNTCSIEFGLEVAHVATGQAEDSVVVNPAPATVQTVWYLAVWVTTVDVWGG